MYHRSNHSRIQTSIGRYARWLQLLASIEYCIRCQAWKVLSTLLGSPSTGLISVLMSALLSLSSTKVPFIVLTKQCVLGWIPSHTTSLGQMSNTAPRSSNLNKSSPNSISNQVKRNQIKRNLDGVEIECPKKSASTSSIRLGPEPAAIAMRYCL